MNNNSSSHSINGDYPLNFKEKLGWLTFNLLDNITPSPKGYKPHKFPDYQSKLELSGINKSDSPSRNLCNLFWANLNIPELLDREPGSEFNLLEVGCGSGRYAEILSSYGNNFHYWGIDIAYSEKWAVISAHRDAKFFIDSADNVSSYLNEIDVVITQSALEHIENDLLFFKELRTHSEKTGKKLVSINLVPSPANLFLSPWHGIRQYGNRAIKSLINISGKSAISKIYLIGGRASTSLHFRELTLKSIMRKSSSVNTEKYQNQLNEALEKDARNSKSASFKNATFIGIIFVFNP